MGYSPLSRRRLAFWLVLVSLLPELHPSQRRLFSLGRSRQHTLANNESGGLLSRRVGAPTALRLIVFGAETIELYWLHLEQVRSS